MAKNSLAVPAAVFFVSTKDYQLRRESHSYRLYQLTSRKPKIGKAMKGYGKEIKQVNYTAGNKSSSYIFYCSLGWFWMHSAKAHCRISFSFNKGWISSRKPKHSSLYHKDAQSTGNISKVLSHASTTWKSHWYQLQPHELFHFKNQLSL